MAFGDFPAMETLSAELRFTDRQAPGIRRRKSGKGWLFLDQSGEPIRNSDTRQRLLSLALPPAYRDAWYNPDPLGHIQATGVDARGRLQYRYHPAFRAEQENCKFESLSEFGRSLPKIRSGCTAALRRRGLGRERVVAAVVKLLDLTQMRIGNERYARANRSFGATTLRRKHAVLESGKLKLQFRAKGGVDRRITVSDRQLASVVRRCQELPGQQLLRWEDTDGEVRSVTSGDVNRWLHMAGGECATAKCFRTWWASVLALDHLAANPGASLKSMLETVSQQLGNTPAVARKSYVHPAVIEVCRGERAMPKRGRGPQTLSAPERRLLGLLEAGQPARRKSSSRS